MCWYISFTLDIFTIWELTSKLVPACVRVNSTSWIALLMAKRCIKRINATLFGAANDTYKMLNWIIRKHCDICVDIYATIYGVKKNHRNHARTAKTHVQYSFLCMRTSTVSHWLLRWPPAHEFVVIYHLLSLVMFVWLYWKLNIVLHGYVPLWTFLWCVKTLSKFAQFKKMCKIVQNLAHRVIMWPKL